MPNSKAERDRQVVAWADVYKGFPRQRIVKAVRELMATNENLGKIRNAFIIGYIARDLGITRTWAVKMKSLRRAGAKGSGEPKRSPEQEAAYGRARVACREIERLAGVQPNKKMSDVKKRSSPPPNTSVGVSITLPRRQLRKLMRAVRRR
jgi:hypothetical protein